MLVLNEAQALIVESLLIKLLISDPYSVSQLEEALIWFQLDSRTVSCQWKQHLLKL
jgi:hypothetical protein